MKKFTIVLVLIAVNFASGKLRKFIFIRLFEFFKLKFKSFLTLFQQLFTKNLTILIY